MLKHFLQHSETTKHITDAIVITTGTGAVTHNVLDYTGHLVEHVVNPILTTVAIITTIVWTIYRIIDMHKKNRNKKDDD